MNCSCRSGCIFPVVFCIQDRFRSGRASTIVRRDCRFSFVGQDYARLWARIYFSNGELVAEKYEHRNRNDCLGFFERHAQELGKSSV